MADSKAETTPLQEAAIETERAGPRQPVGKVLKGARESRGLSANQVAGQAHVPEHYIKMIESNDYSLIADKVYLLPFLRRYAEFVGLDPEDVAIRFVRDVQRADTVAERMPDPIPMLDRKPRGRRRLLVMLLALLTIALTLAGLALHHERARNAGGAAVFRPPPPAVAPGSQSSPAHALAPPLPESKLVPAPAEPPSP